MKLTIGERIKECRKNINLTQEQLAEKLCVSFQTVSRWENGNSYPDIEMLPLLAQLFDKLCLKVEFFRDAEGGLTVQPSYSNDENGRVTAFRGRHDPT